MNAKQERQRIEKLKNFAPWIKWEEPIIVGTRELSRFGCRLCIAFNGMRSEDVKILPDTMEKFYEHMKTVHHLDTKPQ